MAFPSNPSDGQQYTQNGFIYQYVAAINLWKKVGTVSSSANTANVNVLTANTANVTSLSAESAYIASLIANNSIGAPGQILASNGTGIYWANSDGFGFTGSRGYTGSIGGLGYTGSIGFTGSTGATGASGAGGYTGSVGDTGYQGSTGTSGATGYQGSLGNFGYQGSTGSSGTTGFRGSQGETGFNGSVGSTGNTGFQGSLGDVGFAGSIGVSGTTGFQGSIGPTGNQGNRGYQGSLGFQGSFGDTGYLGSSGNQGLTGFQGSAGNTGYTGSIGDTGFRGSVGSQGPQGLTGYTGSVGDTGYQGSSGFVGSTGSGYTGSTGFTGSKGDQGIQGYTGSAAEFAGGYVGSVSATTLSATSVTTESGVIDLLTSQNVTVQQGISVGNTTVNTSITATQIFSGNTYANAKVTTTSISVSNSLSTSDITSQIIFVGNTVANASFNLIGGTATHSASRLTVSSTGVVRIQTSSDHGLASLYGVYANFNGFDRSWINNPRLLVANTPTSNTISFTLGSTVLGNALKINAVKRVNGFLTYETVTPHGLLLNDTVNITGIPSTIDAGRFNVTGGVVNTIPTSNTFTIYDSVKANKIVNTSGTVTISSQPLDYASAGTIYLNVDLGQAHQFRVNELVTISGVTGLYAGAATTAAPLGRAFNLNGAFTVRSVTANAFQIVAFVKSKKSALVPGGSNTVTFSGTFNAVVNNDISNTKITTSAYSSLPIINNIPIANGTITYSVPIYISVGNTVSATKITPTSIFVGDLTGNSVIIDSAGTRYKRTGSILETAVDGSGFSVTSVLADGGALDPNTASFIANTSVISIGNTTSTTIITQEAVLTSNVLVGQENTRVNITSEAISIEDSSSISNTVINNYLASFPNDLSVGSTLFVNAISDSTGSLGTSGQVLTSNGAVSYWATPTGGGGGSSVTISDTPPVSPSAGNLWYHSASGELYIYYDDGDTSQWVSVSSTGSGLGGGSSVTSGRSFAHAWFFGG